MRLTDRAKLAFFLAASLIWLPSCSDRMGAQVSGTVMLDGKPLTTGAVSFHPVGGGAVAYGSINAKGEFAVSTGTAVGIAPGSYAVTVVATEVVVPASLGEAEVPPKLITPEKYGNVATTELKAEVKPGKNTIPLALVSAPAAP